MTNWWYIIPVIYFVWVTYLTYTNIRDVEKLDDSIKNNPGFVPGMIMLLVNLWLLFISSFSFAVVKGSRCHVRFQVLVVLSTTGLNLFAMYWLEMHIDIVRQSNLSMLIMLCSAGYL